MSFEFLITSLIVVLLPGTGVMYLFFLAFLPQFVSSNTPNPTLVLIGLAAVFMTMTFIIFVCYGAFAAMARDYIIRSPSVMQWIRRCFAGTFVFLGLKLA